jgi:hypothetical protein
MNKLFFQIVVNRGNDGGALSHQLKQKLFPHPYLDDLEVIFI